ncbi:hypothetical protein BD779DRAFT_1478444 [Infundibulicybe gibba]|nr:hypothetical protein BD779DRAFT_1478444 [Infundibulicybe gibba]
MSARIHSTRLFRITRETTQNPKRRTTDHTQWRQTAAGMQMDDMPTNDGRLDDENRWWSKQPTTSLSQTRGSDALPTASAFLPTTPARHLSQFTALIPHHTQLFVRVPAFACTIFALDHAPALASTRADHPPPSSSKTILDLPQIVPTAGYATPKPFVHRLIRALWSPSHIPTAPFSSS